MIKKIKKTKKDKENCPWGKSREGRIEFHTAIKRTHAHLVYFHSFAIYSFLGGVGREEVGV